MDSQELTVETVENFLYSDYIKNYKKKLVKSKDPNGITRTIDMLKIHYLTSILPFQLDKVYIKPSKIHGLGAFAKRDIRKGELITFYPGDILEFTPNKDRHLPKHLLINYSSERFQDTYGKTLDNRISKRNNDYALKVDDYFTIISEPSFDTDSNYMGHLINDGACLSSSNINNEQAIELYVKISFMKANCRYYMLKEGLHMAMVATRDIKKDEELLAMYGVDYWKFNT